MTAGAGLPYAVESRLPGPVEHAHDGVSLGAVSVGAVSLGAVSWGAILGGAVASVTVSLILILLASGFELATIAPWGGGAAAATVATGIALIIVQWLSAAMGGYITGRLRADWVGVHTHEVFFRDTAHGFLTWAVATLAGIALTASAAGTLLSGGAQTAAQVAHVAAQQAPGMAMTTVSPYDLDELFRGSPATTQAGGGQGAWRGEAAQILTHGLAAGGVTSSDRTYLAELVAAHTGLSQPDAQARVDSLIGTEQAAEAKARQAAEAARKAASEGSIFLVLSMLVGAFIASTAAAYGGGSRDKYRPRG